MFVFNYTKECRNQSQPIATSRNQSLTMTTVAPTIEKRNVDRWVRNEQQQLTGFKGSLAQSISPVYKQPTWSRYIWKAVLLPICCTPCCLYSCAGRTLFCDIGGNACTRSSDNCLVNSCNAVDEVETDSYEWIASLTAQQPYVANVKEILTQWVDVAESVAKMDVVPEQRIRSVLNRISIICSYMTYNKNSSNVVYQLNKSYSMDRSAILAALHMVRSHCLT